MTKLHPVSLVIGLTALLAAAAGAAEIAYIPTLPAPTMPLGIPMIPNLPSRIERIIPGQLPTRSLPGYSTTLPLPMRVPSVIIPGPLPTRVILPSRQPKSGLTLPGAAVATGKISLAGKGSASDARNLTRFFDGSSKAGKQAPIVTEDGDEISPVRGDSSHLTLPESDLEIEIGLR